MRYFLSLNSLALLVVTPLPSYLALCSDPEPEVETCDDGVDNDEDGYTDCADSECDGGAEIVINEIQHHPSKSNDVDGEYVELYNYGEQCVSLAGWTISEDSGLPATQFPSDAVIAPGALYVVAGTMDNTKNCSVYADAAFSYDSTLNDGCDTIVIKDSSGTVRAQVSYCTGSNGWPSCADGTAMEYCGGLDSAQNNTGTNWTCSTSTYGCGDYGTPSMANKACY